MAQTMGRINPRKTSVSFQQAKLSVVAAERDSAVREMRHMAEQCQRVAGEFDAMAQHCDLLERENKRVGFFYSTWTL